MKTSKRQKNTTPLDYGPESSILPVREIARFAQ
jgi:hypothetical protein